jgi:uncharacterized repeat protein (TIGR01451 family)
MGGAMMPANKGSWRIWIKLLAIPVAAAALLLFFFSGLRGHAGPAPEPSSADASLESSAKPPSSTPLQIASSATITVCESDVVLLFDHSGSMEFDAICYGCWEVDDRDYYDYGDWPPGEAYPDGDPHPLAYPNSLCAAPTYYTYSDHEYIIIEAEHFYDNWPIFNPDYRGAQSGVKSSYWGLQRNGRGSSAVGDDPSRCDGVSGARAGCGGYMQHNPFCIYADDDELVYDPTELADAPQLIYRFQVPSDGTYELWLRGQGANNSYSANVDSRTIHWGLNGSYEGTSTNFQTGPMYDGARYNSWRWRQVDSFNLAAGWMYDLSIWAGGAGFRLDKIVITNETNNATADNILRNSGSVEQRKGPPATAGLSGFACWDCYPFWGPPSSPTCQTAWDNNPQWEEMYSAMFDDKQYLRAAKEAAKYFVEQADPGHHQIGLVSYSNSSNIDSELECIKRLGSNCSDYLGVIDGIEVLNSSGSTSMASALWDGILAQLNGPEQAGDPLTRVVNRLHYGRAGANKFIILMTDGVPNVSPGGPSCGDLYPDGGTPYDCVIYYAQQARDNGIIVHPIGLGGGVDAALLQEVADITGGTFYPVARKEDLVSVMDALAQELFYGCPLTLGISKHVTPTVGVGGEPLTYSIAISSTATFSATGVLIQDTLPEGTAFITANGTFSPAHPLAGETVIWDVGTLPYDGTPLSVTLVLSAVPSLSTFTNTATVLCDRGISVTSSAVATVVEPEPSPWFLYLPLVLKDAGPETW